MEIISQYQEELQKDMYIDEINVTQAAYNLPAIKHKWVARLINTKIKINKLESQKKELRSKAINNIKQNHGHHLPLISIDRSLDTNSTFLESVAKIDEELEQHKMIVLYLEKVEGIFKNMTFDIKNIVDLARLETT